MVCWIVPLAATAAAFIRRRASCRRDSRGLLLNMMLLGGTLFGAVDYLWNGELFLVGSNWATDLALGAVITGAITAGWGFIAFRPKITGSIYYLSHRLGILKK